MTCEVLWRRLVLPAAIVTLSLATANESRSSDVKVVPKAPGAAPGEVGLPPCPTCPTPSAGCATGHCRPGLLGHAHKGPYQTYLCPGACFGYFQTQWHKWDEVCPLPYQGLGVTDAPKPPTAAVTPPPKPLPDPKKGTTPPLDPKKGPDGSDLPLPRPVNPMPDKGGVDSSYLPAIPPAPGGLPPLPGTRYRQ